MEIQFSKKVNLEILSNFFEPYKEQITDGTRMRCSLGKVPDEEVGLPSEIAAVAVFGRPCTLGFFCCIPLGPGTFMESGTALRGLLLPAPGWPLLRTWLPGSRELLLPTIRTNTLIIYCIICALIFGGYVTKHT